MRSGSVIVSAHAIGFLHLDHAKEAAEKICKGVAVHSHIWGSHSVPQKPEHTSRMHKASDWLEESMKSAAHSLSAFAHQPREASERSKTLIALGALGFDTVSAWCANVPGQSLAAVTHHSKKCGPQDPSNSDVAESTYAAERESFTRPFPHAAATYQRLAARVHDAERLSAVAFLVGFNFGVCGTQLDPLSLCAKLEGEDWPLLRKALHEFLHSAALTHGGCTFEPQHRGLMAEVIEVFGSPKARAEAFFASLRPLAEACLKVYKDLGSVMIEVAGPLVLLKHMLAMCTPPFFWLVEQLAIDAFRIAHKADREADIAAVHFLRAAWKHTPRGPEQWHDIGHNLGIVCLATVGI
eukprot:TRINITY_DN54358_c0_g1_i1.p1 TRINITY_DN54358_c0_g1~~TRINITY_DN54358_c0_g1_i1.p1  ORF type:complete len:353 (+),score=51.40 TRINITY_DN54358_c0_g1_i1:327-1385(+)